MSIRSTAGIAGVHIPFTYLRKWASDWSLTSAAASCTERHAANMTTMYGHLRSGHIQRGDTTYLKQSCGGLEVCAVLFAVRDQRQPLPGRGAPHHMIVPARVLLVGRA
jgi:hypothetical protein